MAWELWLAIFVLGSLALDLWLWILGLGSWALEFGFGSLAWDLWLGNLWVEILALGNRDPQAGGTDCQNWGNPPPQRRLPDYYEAVNLFRRKDALTKEEEILEAEDLPQEGEDPLPEADSLHLQEKKRLSSPHRGKGFPSS